MFLSRCILHGTLLVVLGVSVDDRSHLLPDLQIERMKILYDSAAINIKGFLDTIVINDHSTTRAMIDCAWMPKHYGTLRSSHITTFLKTIYLPRPNMSIMLDFGLNSVNKGAAISVGTMMREIDVELSGNNPVKTWYHQTVQILWPIQTVFERPNIKNCLCLVKFKRKSIKDRCFCLVTLIDLHFGHIHHGAKSTDEHLQEKEKNTSVTNLLTCLRWNGGKHLFGMPYEYRQDRSRAP